jgi:hypothetical protein
MFYIYFRIIIEIRYESGYFTTLYYIVDIRN